MIHSSEVKTMPRKTDESNYRPNKNDPKKMVLKSMAAADQKRDLSTDSIRLRVPKGMRERIQDYVKTLPEYQRIRTKVKEEDGNPKIEPNVNKWLIDLIERELPRKPEDDKV